MNTRFAVWLSIFVFAATYNSYAAKQFQRQQLEKFYWSEGANFGDLNNDGKLDAISGPYWWEGPAFTKRHKFYADKTTFETTDEKGKKITYPGFVGAFGKRNSYSGDNFFTFAHDFTGDGWNDVLTYGLPGTPAYLYVNNHDGSGLWERHQVFDKVDNESPEFLDVTGDGKPEIVCNFNGQFGYAQPGSDPTKKWPFKPITQGGKWGRFTHGLGVGDVNGDQKNDILFKHGWFEQPKSWDGKTPWKLHSFAFSPGGGAQMYAYDVNGDGLNDVITSLAAHGYGLAWYEQIRKDGAITFKSHAFMNTSEKDNRYGVKFSQLHAVRLEDMNGDGLKDIITGKTFWAHGPTKDPEPNQPAVVYWFELKRDGKRVDWIPHLIDDDSGIGRQIGIADINNDGRSDVINGNKKGTFTYVQTAKDAATPSVKNPQFWDQDLSAKRIVTRTGAPRSSSTKFVPPPTPMAKGGVLPKGKDGKSLNLDFEKGTLEDWTATGKAWDKQPHKGNINQSRKYGNGRYSLYQGKYWLGGYEFFEDLPKGTLTSAPFKITHPYAAFRIGGGRHDTTCVELVRTDTKKVFFKVSGRNSETMSVETVDLRSHAGKEMFIRVVDNYSGGWGHVNFDDFRFYPQRPRFPGTKRPAPRVNPADAKLKVDEVEHAGLSPAEAIKAMSLPKGFSATVFAAEPDVKQPIAMCLDDRGRMWIAEAYAYPFRKPEGQGKDRLLCFEDTNGDGKHDRRTVVVDDLNLVSGIEYGFGGLWVGAAPYLYFVPIQDGDKPKAGKPQVILEGWAWQDTHETLNSFRWGPDGWLYGCHGVFTHSHVKRPEQPDTERQFINAGVFRLHPVTKQFEVFAEGTSNPWGIDFNNLGHAFIEACVIPHFWHIIQGAKYQRQGGQHYAATHDEIARVAPDYWKQNFKAARPSQPLHPYVYDDIKTHGDHLHYLGSRPHIGNNKSDSAGGGHAHAGLMIYQGDSWPAQYRGKVFIGNIHGQRINVDIPTRVGSGYVGKHAPDFLNFNDRWSQALNFRTDQNGSVYIIDWYDANQCHRREEGLHDRSNGRIYKVLYDNQKWSQIDYAAKSDRQLFTLLSGSNEMPARHAKRLLQERAAAGKLDPKVRQAIRNNLHATDFKMFTTVTGRLRLLWALHVTGGISEPDALPLLRDENEYIRAWTIQLICEGTPSKVLLDRLAELAKTDPSAHVRLYLASAAQRVPVHQRLPILEGLLSHSVDAKDHNLPLMYWYATEPVVGASRLNAVKLLTKTKIPVIRQYITRRMTAGTK